MKRHASLITHDQSASATYNWLELCVSSRDLALNTILDFNVTQMSDLHSIMYYTYIPYRYLYLLYQGFQEEKQRQCLWFPAHFFRSHF